MRKRKCCWALLLRAYYFLKPLVPRQLQIYLRRKRAARIIASLQPGLWPIDLKASRKPSGWAGWPHQKRFALVLTHDVETGKGQHRCLSLMNLEKELGFRSSFNFVAMGYPDRPYLREALDYNGFEVGIHGLRHRGSEYLSKRKFRKNAEIINSYLKAWKAVGFRAPCMYHNFDWFRSLQILYDASTFDTDPFEPQSDGVGTIFPFWIPANSTSKGYVEMPYTLVQDFTLFVVLRERSIDIWKDKLDWIAENEGMALINTHPDYMCFDGQRPGIDEYPVAYYYRLLQYIADRYRGKYWNATPTNVAQFWEQTFSRT